MLDNERARVLLLREKIFAREPKSDFVPAPASLINRLRDEHPDIPTHLLLLLELVGQGAIGNSRYCIRAPLDPRRILSAESADGLAGFVLVGDDFAGYCAAYDTRKSPWKFGEVCPSREFTPHAPYRDFIAFLDGWVLKHS